MKPAPTAAINVARYFLVKANREGDLVTNLKLQKLLYYVQAWYLVNYNEPLFRESIHAWALGPVVREVYQEFRKFGAAPIKYEEHEAGPKIFTKEQKNYLDEFYDVFFKFTAHELVNMTHNETPWMEAYKNKRHISRDAMKVYYTALLKEHNENGKTRRP